MAEHPPRPRRCVYCGTEYEVPVGEQVDSFTTADVPPPYGHVVRVGGVIVHECSSGVEVER